MIKPIALPTNSSEESAAATEVFNSIKISLADLCAKGRVQYALKNYELAADFYSRATELQAELNGELNTENAEILFLYGRSLFKLGQSKSDILGGSKDNRKEKRKSSLKPEMNSEIKEDSEGENLRDCNKTTLPVSPASNLTENYKQKLDLDLRKPLFQFTGDENFEDSDEDEVQEGINEEDTEANGDDDDLAAAFDVLDLARILFEKKLKEPEDKEMTDTKGKVFGDSPMMKHYKERLADTHDILAEISLENERFPSAVTDCKAALAYKQELYKEETSLIAEAHFKLSLALEFASITSPRDDHEESNGGNAVELDQSLRDEAVKEMEAAISSTELRLKAEEAELLKSDIPDDIATMQNQIAEVKEVLSELQSRLEELKGPPVDVKSALFGPLVGQRGILSATINESPEAAATRIEEAKKKALDVTGLIRKKSKIIDQPVTIGKSEKRKAVSCDESPIKRAKSENMNEGGEEYDTQLGTTT